MPDAIEPAEGTHPAWLAALGRALDAVETGLAVFAIEADGDVNPAEPVPLEPVARNAYLAELLADEPEAARLLELAGRFARAAPEAGRDADNGAEVDLPGGVYRLAASRAPAGTLLAHSATLVLVDRMSSRLPTTRELRMAFGLRGREPQVALLAAEGLSNAAIAARLRLSAHTVRHYLERVLDRLGLHTRKALALHLMAGAAERPEPPPQRDRDR
jgi:DNA-binding CsgD family transcriptional regulator